MDARLRVLGHAASRLCAGLLPGRACRPLGAGEYALRPMWPVQLVAVRPMPDRAGDS